jgi:hypothetical protein
MNVVRPDSVSSDHVLIMDSRAHRHIGRNTEARYGFFDAPFQLVLRTGTEPGNAG